MLVRASPSALKEGRWYEYLIRFALGGAATVFAGWIATRFGPVVGGLFLAMPVIFCASATLIETHEVRRKREAGQRGERRGRQAAALDAAGAALGGVGLVFFAIVFAAAVERSPAAAFVYASAAWLFVSVAAWGLRHRLPSARHLVAKGRTVG
ncbi:MAG TPA: hypothetical protein VMM15_08540 [Bradyrhizobium sp.]|nr:hypothetical protein [Bradyrhizobium sp.]